MKMLQPTIVIIGVCVGIVIGRASLSLTILHNPPSSYDNSPIPDLIFGTRNTPPPTPTSTPTPATIHACTSSNYSPSVGKCVIDTTRMSQGDATDGHLILADPAHGNSAYTIAGDIGQVQPDGSWAEVYVFNDTFDGNYSGGSWLLGTILPTHWYGGVKPGQYRINLSLDGRALPFYYLTVAD